MKGIAVSKGVAIGKAYLLDSSKLCILKQKLKENEVEKGLGLELTLVLVNREID